MKTNYTTLLTKNQKRGIIVFKEKRYERTNNEPMGSNKMG